MLGKPDALKWPSASAGAERKRANDTSIKRSNDQARRESVRKQQQRKTKFCMWHFQGSCRLGGECTFAHSLSEMHSTPDQCKRPDLKGSDEGKCQEAACNFVQTDFEMRFDDPKSKKTSCAWNDSKKAIALKLGRDGFPLAQDENKKAIGKTTTETCKKKSKRSSLKKHSSSDIGQWATMAEPMKVQLTSEPNVVDDAAPLQTVVKDLQYQLCVNIAAQRLFESVIHAESWRLDSRSERVRFMAV